MRTEKFSGAAEERGRQEKDPGKICDRMSENVQVFRPGAY